jgi:regulator of protease activity HflC (stomatin/prohibitin superfamily)
MNGLLIALVVIARLALLGLALSVRIVQQYERGVLFSARRCRSKERSRGLGAAGSMPEN